MTYTTIAFIAVGIGIWTVMAPRFFPTQPGGGINITRVLAASVVCGGAGAIGAGVGKLIERLRK